MSVTSGFFDSMNKDRLYNTRQLSSIFDGIIKDGVYMGYEDALMVKASEPASLTVNVGPGRSWFNHTWTYNDAPLPIEVDPGDVVLDRIDTIVNDVDTRSSVRKNAIILVKGTPSSQATAPVLINEEGHRQYPLCNISMPAGSTTVTQAQITNRIGTSDCPFVTGIIETISTDELLAQWNAEYREWYARVQAEIDQWTEQEQTEFTEWMNGRKEEFDAWFSGLQTILDGDVAGNLLNRINHRTGINATATYSAGVVAITAPDDAGEILTFVAPSDFLSSDTYTLNGEALTITDLNGEALDEAWKKSSPITITVSGGKAFFKAGGSGKNDTLPPLLGNMTVEVVEGDENDTYTIKMDKLVLDETTEMVGGAQLEWGEEMPAKPGKGTGGIKIWTRDEVITTGKPYDGLYAEDMQVSDTANIQLFWMPENSGSYKVLVPYISTLAETGTPVQLKDIPVGNFTKPTKIEMKEYDAEVTYVYVLSGYGDNRDVGLLIRESVSDKGKFDNTSNARVYAGSVIDTYCINFIERFPEEVKKYLIDVVVPVRSSTVNRKCFIPSMTELGLSVVGFDPIGPSIPYFESNDSRKANYLGSPSSYWTRHVNSSGMALSAIMTDGTNAGTQDATNINGYRPFIVVSLDAWLFDNGDGTYTFVGDEPVSSEFVSHTVEVPHGQKVVFRQFTQNQKKQFQTMLVGGVYPPLGDVEPPFALPEFTGNHMIYGDEIEGRIELLESGDLTLSPGVYDIFAVGGGSSGIFGGYKQGSKIWHTVGGGGSGYTKTLKGYVQERSAVLNVIIGAGGAVRTQTDNQANLGSATKIVNALSQAIIEAPGGGKRNNSAVEAEAGQPGGSGGGSGGGDYNRGGNGGSDGSNGEAYGNTPAGQGQNTTTKAFEESSSTIYAGGGSGFNNSYRAPGGGGAGGIDGQQQTARDGTTNTGSGGGAGYKNSRYNVSCGAGGSGIIIIRWKNA